jgi:hypothetical protein
MGTHLIERYEQRIQANEQRQEMTGIVLVYLVCLVYSVCLVFG